MTIIHANNEHIKKNMAIFTVNIDVLKKTADCADCAD